MKAAHNRAGLLKPFSVQSCNAELGQASKGAGNEPSAADTGEYALLNYQQVIVVMNLVPATVSMVSG